MSRRRFRDSPTIPGEPVIDAERARTEGRDLKQATRQHDILEEVDI